MVPVAGETVPDGLLTTRNGAMPAEYEYVCALLPTKVSAEVPPFAPELISMLPTASMVPPLALTKLGTPATCCIVKFPSTLKAAAAPARLHVTPRS